MTTTTTTTDATTKPPADAEPTDSKADRKADLTPKRRMQRATSIVSDHDRYWKGKQSGLAEIAAAAETRFWAWVEGQGKKGGDGLTNRYETNRIKPASSTYFSQLFPRQLQAEVSERPSTTGDADKAALALNDWMFDLDQMQRWDSAVRQGVHYDGVGFSITVNHDDTHKSPDERVELNVFPIWEAVVDREVYDVRHQRFRGHVGWRPLHEVAEEFGIPEDDLTGCRKQDFLDEHAYGDSPRTTASADKDTSDLASQWVRVLALCNFVDDFVEDDGTVHRGSYEIHLLDQGELSREPVHVGIMPLVDPSGDPTPNIHIHFFETRAEYPLQGIAPARQLMPAQRELNASRSHGIDKATGDKVIYLSPDSIPPDIRDKINEAKDNETFYIDPKIVREAGGLDKVRVPIQTQRMSADVTDREDKVERDLTAAIALSPSAMGERQNVTAEEIQYQRDFTDSEFGRQAASWERTLRTLAAMYLMGLCSALSPEQARLNDMDGSEDTDDGDDADTSAPITRTTHRPDYEKDPDEQSHDVLTEAASSAEGDDDGDDDGDGDGEPATKLVLHDNLKRKVSIVSDDIDSWFQIGFSDAGRTPGARLEIRTNLIQILPMYAEQWEKYHKGGHMAVLALAVLRAVYANFQLPPTLDPDKLLAEEDKRKKAEKESKGPPSDDPLAEAAPAPGGAPAQPAAAPPGAPQGVAPSGAPGSGPGVEEALVAVETAFSDIPEVQAEVDRIRQLPPDQQVPAIEQLMAQLKAAGEQQAQAEQQGAAPPAAAPAPGGVA